MTHGVFVQALRDAMVFMTLIIGCPIAVGLIFKHKLRG